MWMVGCGRARNSGGQAGAGPGVYSSVQVVRRNNLWPKKIKKCESAELATARFLGFAVYL